MNRKISLMVFVVLCVALTVNAALFDGQSSAIGVMSSNGMGYWYQVSTDGRSTSSTKFAYGGNAGIAAGDIDSDGKVDFFRGGGAGNTSWYEAKDAPDYGYASVVSGVPSGGSVNNGFSINDFDGDGNSDVFRVTSSNILGWYESNGTNSGLSWRANWSGVNAVATGNFDGDSQMDLFIIGSTQITWRESSADNAAGWVGNIGYSGVKDMVIGNFDGDAYADMFLVRSDGQIDWLETNGNDVWGTSNILFGSLISCVEIGDIDGDGIDELFAGRSSGGILMYESDGLGFVGDPTSLDFGSSAADLAIYTVPEPATLALFGLGLSFLTSRKRKK